MTTAETTEVTHTDMDKKKDNVSSVMTARGGTPVSTSPPGSPIFDFGQDHAKVESWLDEHPEYFQDYLIRKGGRNMIDAWLVAHALPPGITTSIHDRVSQDHHKEDLDENHDDNTKQTEDEDSNNHSTSTANEPRTTRTFSCGSKGSSGSGTPVRKISAHEFEKGGLTKPLVNTIDGTPTFLSPPNTNEVSGQIRKRSRYDVQGLKETDLIFELVKDICHDLDIRRLCHKILQNVGILTNADR